MSEASVDLELVRRVQKGDKTAFDILVLKYQQKMANLVSRYVREPAEVQDVCQDAFIKAYRGLANFRGESAFYTWLYRIAVNTAKNHLVSQGRRSTQYAVDAQEAEQFSGAEVLHENASPERELLSSEIQEAVRESIDSLPEDLKVAITLREFEGMSYDEIADIMECPIGTVRSRIFRAREAINTNLHPLLNETDEGLEREQRKV
ncbi:MAG: RNA polymerase sigma factor RpoE [Pseudomonadota bacterium]